MMLGSALGARRARVVYVPLLHLGLLTMAWIPVTTSPALLHRASIKLCTTAVALVFDPERYQAYHYALPIQTVRRVAPKLVKHGRTTMLMVVVVLSTGRHATSSVIQVRHFRRGDS